MRKEERNCSTILKNNNFTPALQLIVNVLIANEGRSSRLKRIRYAVEGLDAAFLEIWERKQEYWDGACEVVGKLLEVVLS